MLPLYAPESQSERLIAAGRVVLSGCSLLAVWLDPAEPAKLAPVAYGLLLTYLGYAIAVALLVWRSRSSGPGQRILSHGFDLVFFSLFVYFTAGPSSPFVVFFVFALVAGTLRWGWQGTLGTAVVAIGTFVGLGVWFSEVLHDPDFELYRFIIRAVYLGVIAVLLGYLGAHQQQTQRVLGMLAAPPDGDPGSDLETVVRDVVRHAAAVVGVDRAVLTWSEREEPWVEVATFAGGRFELRRRAPDPEWRAVGAGLEAVAFLWARSRGGTSEILRSGARDAERWVGDPVDPTLAPAGSSGVAVPVDGDTVTGRLILVGAALTSDQLLLGEIVATVAAARLDHVVLTRELGERAANEERIRLARDLHDGILQSLTGVALRVMTVRGLLDSDPDAARQRLEELQRLIALEQRELRFFIQDLTPGPAAESEPLDGRLEELVDRVEREWDLAVDRRFEGLEHAARDLRARDVYLLVREALVNAARHGEASRIEVALTWTADGTVTLGVRDDGRGFPFLGQFDEKTLAALGLGPRTLRERVSSLAGSLDLVSSREGSRLQIALPAPEGALR